MASRVTRVSPCEEPYSCGGSNRSKPMTFAPRLASASAAALPIAPRPTMATSYRVTWFLLRLRGPPKAVEGAEACAMQFGADSSRGVQHIALECAGYMNQCLRSAHPPHV